MIKNVLDSGRSRGVKYNELDESIDYDNDIVNYGFLGFDTTSKTFKLINNINYNSNTNVSILPNYNLYGTLEILNLK